MLLTICTVAVIIVKRPLEDKIMLLDIRKIFNTYNKPVCHNITVDLSDEDFPGYSVSLPANVCVTLSLDGSILSLIVSIDACVNTECARCTDPISRQFHTSRTYLIRAEDMLSEDTELTFTSDGKLDVKELAFTELLLEVPTVLLCSDTCEGLCPVCGNKKAMGCTCADNATDERLTILKQLLS